MAYSVTFPDIVSLVEGRPFDGVSQFASPLGMGTYCPSLRRPLIWIFGLASLFVFGCVVIKYHTQLVILDGSVIVSHKMAGRKIALKWSFKCSSILGGIQISVNMPRRCICVNSYPIHSLSFGHFKLVLGHLC